MAASGYDTVIVGAGSAGCVLAARLSEDPDRRVLLTEAGPDYAALDDLPPEIRSPNHPAYTHDWGYVSEPGALGRPVELNRARVVGGCSATNATVALRGNPADYDGWRDLGNPGWGFEDVLPFFCRLEHDLDFDDPWHGRDGLVPVRRYPASEHTAVQAAFLEACAAAGFPEAADHNRPGAVGAGPVPVNAVDGVRRSCALTYLDPARPRANLTIRAGTLVDHVVVRGGRATAVRPAGGGEIGAGEVLLCAGAYGSPAVLLRSGIGPADDLAALGIPVLLDAPGVGRNLADHPLFPLVFEASDPAPPGMPSFQTLLTAASSRAGPGTHDLQVLPMYTAHDPEEARLFMLAVAATKPRSRGRMQLRSADPDAAPAIDEGLLADGADLAVLTEGVAFARALAAMAPLARSSRGERYPGRTELRAAIRETTGTYFHPAGTCRMGPASDPHAVVDHLGRVHGVECLRVVDASIMPDIPAANTNVPTIMVAERIAAACAAGAFGPPTRG